MRDQRVGGSAEESKEPSPKDDDEKGRRSAAVIVQRVHDGSRILITGSRPCLMSDGGVLQGSATQGGGDAPPLLH